MSLPNSKKQIYRQFFEKTGIQLTEESIPGANPEIADELEELYHLAQTRPRKALPRLEKLVVAYPQVPSIKNYLQVCYTYTDQFKKAKAIQERTVKEHPDYVFGIFNAIMNLHTKEELEKQAHLLGTPRHIHTLTGERLLHISEYVNYQMAAAHFEALTGETDSAVERLDTLIAVETPKPTLKTVAEKIAVARMKDIGQNLSKMQEGRITVESFPKVKFEPTVKPPKLLLSELNILYQSELNTSDFKVFEDLMQLPTDDLISDLETMVDDCIQRFEFLQSLEYDEDKLNFIINALYFLGALKAEKSLNKVLNLLRMGDDFIDYWFGDMREMYFHPTIYSLGEGQLDILKDFALEENLAAFNRLLVVHPVAQIALHQPHRRKEVIKWFEEVFRYLLENEDNKAIIDSDFISFSVSNVIKIRGLELIPLITKMYEKKWIPDNILGDLKTILKEINKPAHPYDIEPWPQNIIEYYTQSYKERRAEAPPISEEDNALFQQTEAEKMVTEYSLKMMTSMLGGKDSDDYLENDYDEYADYEYVKPVQPVIREAPKVGRNDPCTCGSGKKYKKCCLRK